MTTTETAIHHTGMIKHRTDPGGGDMAGITRCRCRNMSWPHTCGDDPVMAGLACARDLRMIHGNHRYPA